MATDLRDEVLQLIKQHRWSKYPPFTVAELVVMGLVLHPGSLPTVIHAWILREFAVYGVQAARALWYATAAKKAPYYELVKNVEAVIKDFEVPLELMADDDSTVQSDIGYVNADWNATMWSVSTGPARIFLAKHLASAEHQEKPFPFMRLPAELRLRIYGLVLGLPRSGVFVAKEFLRGAPRGKSAMAVITRDYDREADMSEWQGIKQGPYVVNRHPGFFKLPDVGQTLSLLLVSKQVYQESMPVFYNSNTFIVRDLGHLAAFMKSIPVPRFDHITHVKLFWTSIMINDAAKIFRGLAKAKRLRQLEISLDVNGWWWTNVQNQEPKLKAVDALLDMLLRDEKPVQITWHGNCDRVKKVFARKKESKKQKVVEAKRKDLEACDRKRKADQVPVQTDGRVVKARHAERQVHGR